MFTITRASSRENLYFGFLTKPVSNQSHQLQRLARKSSKFTYDTFQKANNKGVDQSARMRRLVCACVVRKTPKTGFLTSRPTQSLLMVGKYQICFRSPTFFWRKLSKTNMLKICHTVCNSNSPSILEVSDH